jgi:hypothetical protein
MDYEISPDPSEAERAAIVAALAAEEEERPVRSPWAEAALAGREPPADEQP